MSKTNFSAYIAIKNQLLNMFKTEQIENNKLPSEAALAQTLDISLATLREALMILALEGYITKRHGAGNYLHPSTLNFENHIFFHECLRRNGYEASSEVVKQENLPSNSAISSALHIEENTPLLQCTTIHYADDNPAILAILSIPRPYLTNPELIEIDEPDFQFLHEMTWKYCRRNLAHSLNNYIPLPLPENVAKLFDMPAGSPIIANDQVFYDVYDIPVMHSYSYFKPEYYSVRILQNWSLSQPV